MSNFWDLINIDEFDKREYFSMDRWEVTFYCKDCKQIVETDRVDEKWYIFLCKKCNSKNIAIWTEESIKTKYKIK
jgi:Zn finger protein HypA/HybF involved in hydrogenase expression